MTGHMTENVYRRYAIVSEADLEAAAQRIAGRAASVTFPSRSAAATGLLDLMAGSTGLEPATSGLTVQCANQAAPRARTAGD